MLIYKESPELTSHHKPNRPNLLSISSSCMMTKTISGIFFLVVIASVPAMGISRSEILANAETWMHPPVPYSQKEYKDGYRTDCSGYVSMAWNTGKNFNTNTLSTISTVIEKDDLKSGDILLKMGTHVAIFESWTDSTKTKYLGYEQAGGKANETKHWEIPYPYWRSDSGYVPRRYTEVVD